MGDRTQPYALQLQPILKEKVWGGRRLERYAKVLPEDESTLVGESWEVADLPSTSVSGGGGGEARSVIQNGPLKGERLCDAIAEWGPELLGDALFARLRERQETEIPTFPLLIKLLDAQENLSVQVHPSNAYAAEHPDAHLKTESWFVLESDGPRTEGDAGFGRIYAGLREGVTRESLRAAALDGTVTDLMFAADAEPRQLYTLPSGTCHALGAGVLVAEVQTASDTTFRLWDWGRDGRVMHIDQAVECATLAPPPDPVCIPSGDEGGRLEVNEHYSIDEVQLFVSALSFGEGGCFAVMVVSGDGTMIDRKERFDAIPMPRGTTVVVPAAVSRDVEIRGTPGLRVLRFGLPDA